MLLWKTKNQQHNLNSFGFFYNNASAEFQSCEFTHNSAEPPPPQKKNPKQLRFSIAIISFILSHLYYFVQIQKVDDYTNHSRLQMNDILGQGNRLTNNKMGVKYEKYFLFI